MTYVFSAWASEYTRLGLLVVGFNQPGMGSPGIPGLCEAWDNYIDNVLFATDTAVHLLGGTWTASGHPNVPLFIYGQSMGGALAIEASRRRPNAYRGVILSAPMCGIAPDSLPNGCSIAMLRCLEAIVPTAALVPQEDILTRCFKCAAQIKRVRARAAEMQFPDQPLLRTGVQLFDATLDIQAHVADFAPPSVLLIQGTLDKVTDGQLTRDFIQQCGAADKTYIAYKNAWHALEWEPVDTRMALIHDLTYWVAARVDAWEEGNPQLTEELQGREGVPVAAWGGGEGAPAVGGCRSDVDARSSCASGDGSGGEAGTLPGPSATSSAGHVAPSVSLGAVPAADSDLEWKREGGVLWGERPEGTGMIPDHDEDFLVVQGGVMPDPARRLKRPSLGQPPEEVSSGSVPSELDHPPLVSSPEKTGDNAEGQI